MTTLREAGQLSFSSSTIVYIDCKFPSNPSMILFSVAFLGPHQLPLMSIPGGAHIVL